jgi:hypothetical protein
MTPTVPASDGKDPAGTSKSMRRKNCPVTSSFIQDGQLDAARIQQGDKELGVSTSKERVNREDLRVSAGLVLPRADGWQPDPGATPGFKQATA